MLAFTYPLADLFGTIFGIFIFIIWLWLLIIVFSDIFRSQDLGGWAKALWVIFVIVLPFLGIFVYLVARGGKMHERAAAQAEQQQKTFNVPTTTPQSPQPQQARQSILSGNVIRELSALALLGAALGFCFGISQTTNRWSAAIFAVLIVLASTAVGALLGLLFGIPRALANSTPKSSAPDGTSAEQAGGSSTARGGYAPNTNLEQVSDWLTKLLLGAGLTQLARLPGALNHLGSYLAPGLGGDNAASFAVAMVVYGVVVGFLLAFLATRLKLGALFKQADQLAAEASATNTAIGLLPAAPVGPTMLQQVGEKTAPAEQRAALDLSQTVQRIEQQTAVPAFSSEAYRRVAQELVAAKLFQQALQIIELGMNQHPDDPTLPIYAGAIYGMYLSDNSSAEKYYFQALAIKPNFAPAYYDLACNAARRHDITAASAYLQQAYSLDPSLRQQSQEDRVWDQLNLRTNPELADLLTPEVGARKLPQAHENAEEATTPDSTPKPLPSEGEATTPDSTPKPLPSEEEANPPDSTPEPLPSEGEATTPDQALPSEGDD